MGLALFELRDRSSEKIVDDFQLADADFEGSVFLDQLLVGFGGLEMAVIQGGGGAGGRVAEVESR